MSEAKRYRVMTRQSELAIKVFGKSQTDLFANSAFALFDTMTDVDSVQVKDRLSLEVEGVDRDDLMVNWMRELLYLFQGSGYLLKEFNVHEAKDNLVRAEVCGEKLDPDRHEIKKDIRSVVFHQSRMDKTGDQWTAQVIFEI